MMEKRNKDRYSESCIVSFDAGARSRMFFPTASLRT